MIIKNSTKYFYVGSLYFIIILFLFLGLFFLSEINYLFFHMLIEFSSIFVFMMIVVITIHSRSYLENDFLKFISFTFFFIAVIDFFHLLTYNGMSVFVISNPNIATQLWIAGRYIQAISFLIGGLILYFKLKIHNNSYLSLILIYFFITTIILFSIFIWHNFPVCYIVGTGLTTFKILSEYVICLIFVLSMILIYLGKNFNNNEIKQLLLVSLVFSILSELSFTLYIDVYGFFNALGHLLKFLSIIIIYRVFIEISLTSPQKIVFTNLHKHSEELSEEIQMINYFIATVTHELKNPITSIKLSNTNLKQFDNKLSLEQKTRLYNSIDNAVEHLQNNIDDLLLSTSLEWNAVTLNLKSTSLLEAIHDAIYEVESFAQAKNIQIIVSTFDDKYILVDKRRFVQILRILLENAIKYSDNGESISIEIKKLFKSQLKQKNSDFVSIDIKDNGIGISKKDQSMIFKRFYRANNVKNINGSGLGLSIAKSLAILHNGDIRFQSQVGLGSTFTVEIPLNKVN